MKTDLTDVTFMIPIRVDSIIRLENLILTTQFLCRYFNTQIKVLEVGSYNSGIVKRLLSNKIDYCFIEDCDSVFYHTKYLNVIADKVKTSFLCIWDVDVIILPTQMIEAIGKLRNEGYDVALPYDGRALDTSEIIRELFVQSRSLEILRKQQMKMQPLHQSLTLRGGAVFITTNAYRKAGMENTAFYGWGSEDFERYDRWTILGYKIYITKGVLYHLTHPRGENSKFSHANQLKNSEFNLFKTRVSSPEELHG